MRQKKKSDSSGEFARVAAEYCALVGRPKGKPHAFLEEAARQIANLYAKALTLPAARPGSIDEAVGGRPQDQRSRVYTAIKKKLGAENSYWEVFHARENEDPVAASLADDLSDIWKDLQEGLDLWTSGKREAAVWSWRFSLRSHWGHHATGALKAIHDVLAAAES